MSKEIKSIQAGGLRLETVVSKATKTKWTKYCKKLNISSAQILRDYIQGSVKGVR